MFFVDGAEFCRESAVGAQVCGYRCRMNQRVRDKLQRDRVWQDKIQRDQVWRDKTAHDRVQRDGARQRQSD